MADAIRGVAGVRLLDFSADPSHNRSVFTFAGDPTAVQQAVLALYERAVADIDLRTHRGEHPRLGAVDVVPLVPIADVTMAQCVALAKAIGAAIAARFHVPVYLYEEASAHPARKRLEDIRRGEFEALAGRMRTKDWAPDFGPAAPHPSAGASIVGARRPLIAFNVNLATGRLEVARTIAAAIRQSNATGLRSVKAIGVALEDGRVAQVSTNLTNYEETPLSAVFDRIASEAARQGVGIVESEIVGLVPAAALNPAIAAHVRLKNFSEDRILEHRLRQA
jgi:glutamate formiminotransferase